MDAVQKFDPCLLGCGGYHMRAHLERESGGAVLVYGESERGERG